MPGISIITICFNNLADLQKTCCSVDGQNRKPDEHWIINGSSTDEIKDWLSNSLQPSYRKWINEQDKGIADAFNKGIDRSAGPVTQILNSGDIYAAEDVLASVDQLFSKNESIQWISGNIRMIRAGKAVTIGKSFEASKLYRGMRSVSHPTWFVKKEVYGRIGLYKSEFKIAMDYDLMCRIANEHYDYLNKELVIFDDTGVSSTKYLDSLKENKLVYESYFGSSIKLLLWQLRLKILYYVLQTGFGKWLFRIKRKLGLENM